MLTDKENHEKNIDSLSENEIRSFLNSSLKDIKIEIFDSVDSTNNICQQIAGDVVNESEYVVISSHQTKGKGRHGRNFFSPSDTGLYMSFLLKNLPYSAEEAAKLTTMAAVSVCEAIEEVSDKEAFVKWVNDIYVSNRKVCGILTEATPSLKENKLEYAIVGIGINVYMPETGFPQEILNKAGAVFDNKVMNVRNRLAAYVINHFMNYYKAETIDYLEEYRRRCFILGQEITVVSGNEQRKATAIDIDDSCRLIVRYDNGNIKTLYSGEILLPSLS
ncbi:MAG TPA: biotin--[acetyl-CoA-carboxylase] ligase [Mogibacterium sp.]|nr:biotin--[acetyl-CoA-carboxylase] ligase [Mogibacterium sp.]